MPKVNSERTTKMEVLCRVMSAVMALDMGVARNLWLANVRLICCFKLIVQWQCSHERDNVQIHIKATHLHVKRAIGPSQGANSQGKHPWNDLSHHKPWILFKRVCKKHVPIRGWKHSMPKCVKMTRIVNVVYSFERHVTVSRWHTKRQHFTKHAEGTINNRDILPNTIKNLLELKKGLKVWVTKSFEYAKSYFKK